MSGDFKRFADGEPRALLTPLAGPGVVWDLAFGSCVLLQPEPINACAQTMIRTLQADEHQRGCLMEKRVLKGKPAYESLRPRLAGDEERFVLLAMHQTLVERGSPRPAGRKKTARRFIAGLFSIVPDGTGWMCVTRRSRAGSNVRPAGSVNWVWPSSLDARRRVIKAGNQIRS